MLTISFCILISAISFVALLLDLFIQASLQSARMRSQCVKIIADTELLFSLTTKGLFSFSKSPSLLF